MGVCFGPHQLSSDKLYRSDPPCPLCLAARRQHPRLLNEPLRALFIGARVPGPIDLFTRLGYKQFRTWARTPNGWQMVCGMTSPNGCLGDICQQLGGPGGVCWIWFLCGTITAQSLFHPSGRNHSGLPFGCPFIVQRRFSMLGHAYLGNRLSFTRLK